MKLIFNHLAKHLDWAILLAFGIGVLMAKGGLWLYYDVF